MGKIISIIFFCSFLLLFFSSCHSQRHLEKRAERNQKRADKLKEDQEKQRNADYEGNLEKFYDMQTAKTKKEMKKNLRQAERFNKHKKEFFLVRWYKSIFSPRLKTTKRKANE